MFRLAVILSVNEYENKVKIKDLYNSAVYDIDLSNHIHFQQMPIKDDIVLYMNLDNKIFKIVKIWQIKDDLLKRQKEFLLKSGELQIQGIYGQYIYLDNNGVIKFVDSTLLNEFELNLEGFIAKLKKFKITTYDDINFIINDKVIIEKKDKFELTIDENKINININQGKASVVIDVLGNISIMGEKVLLGNEGYGDVITSGVFGTHPVCPVTGALIIGSKKVKAE